MSARRSFSPPGGDMSGLAAAYPHQRHELANGLRVVLQPDARVPLVAVNLYYHVGSKNERPGLTGFAHLFEHMLFQGSEHVGTNEHFGYIQRVGGSANGSTWFDYTSYYETLPAHHLDLGLWLESDRMGYLLAAMDQEKLDNQRDVVMNERRQRIDNQPYGRAFERLQEMAFPEGHPYRWPVIGYMEDIEAATLEDVEAFFRAYYVPNNAVLTLAGDFEPEDALARVERYLGDIPRGAEVEPVRLGDAPSTTPGERRDVQPDHVELPRLYLAYRAPAFGAADWYAGDLLASTLAAGKSSPLYRDLVYERQLAQDVTATLLPMELESAFLISATARADADLRAVEAAIDAQLGRVAQARLDPGELERARRSELNTAYSRLQTLDQRSDLLSMYTTLLDDPGRMLADLETYERTEVSELESFAQRYLVPEKRCVLDVVPQGQDTGAHGR